MRLFIYVIHFVQRTPLCNLHKTAIHSDDLHFPFPLIHYRETHLMVFFYSSRVGENMFIQSVKDYITHKNFVSLHLRNFPQFL